MSASADPYADLKQHRLKPEMLGTLTRVITSIKIQKRRRHFIRVPWIWVERLAEARYIATYRVALHVLYLHWKGGGKPFTLANGGLTIGGVERRAKWRALRELEQFGLIAIERRRRKSPRITILMHQS